jgi:hypothetical protein
VPIRVAEVELADVPRLVGRRVGDLQAFGDRALVRGVDVVDPDRHPRALVGLLPGVGAGRRGLAAAAAALPVAAQEDLEVAGDDRAEVDRAGVRAAPLEPRLPAQLAEPGDAGLDVRHVEDRDDLLDLHAAFQIPNTTPCGSAA